DRDECRNGFSRVLGGRERACRSGEPHAGRPGLRPSDGRAAPRAAAARAQPRGGRAAVSAGVRGGAGVAPMSVSVAARVRAMPRTTAALPKVYAAAAVFWLVTRL